MTETQVTERLSPILENLNEDPWGSSAIGMATYLHGFTYLPYVQPSITFSELFCESPESLTAEAINMVL